MNETALILRMVVDCMAGRREAMWELYEEYVKIRYLHVPVREILAWKEMTRCGRYNAVSGLFTVAESGVSRGTDNRRV